MKLILSRKGFDAKFGGCASPILEDGSILSIPIPDRASPIAYRDIRDPSGEPIAPLVSQLSRGRIRANQGAHLDPDLHRGSLARVSEWRPLFGQAGAAQAHLNRCQVAPGDLFLFFGWFRRVERVARRFRFVRGAPDLHIVFGWMQIGAVITVNDTTGSEIPWAAYHPHLSARKSYTRNTLHVASVRLNALELDLPGAGTFPRFKQELCLTDVEPYQGRSTWRLPRSFEPNSRPSLSRHNDPKRWRIDRDAVRLRTVPIGQEFVLDLDLYPRVRDWLRSVFSGIDD